MKTFKEFKEYLDEKKNDPCWSGYEQIGTKKKGKREVPNCVPVDEDWQKVNRQDNTDGLSQAAVNAYRRENPGSKLQTAVTEKNPSGKRAARRKSFCARMSGMEGPMKDENGEPTAKAKALKRWRC